MTAAHWYAKWQHCGSRWACLLYQSLNTWNFTVIRQSNAQWVQYQQSPINLTKPISSSPFLSYVSMCASASWRRPPRLNLNRAMLRFGAYGSSDAHIHHVYNWRFPTKCCVCAYDLDPGNIPLNRMVMTMGPKVNISVSAEGRVKGPEQAHHHLDLVQGWSAY